MVQSNSNTSRILQELVSLEAWHKPLVFDEASPFHVALMFHDARYSSESRSPVSFRVQLKRATLIVVCDENLRVPKATKKRVYPPMEETVRISSGETALTQLSANTEVSGTGSGSLKDGASVSTTAKAGAAASRQLGNDDQLERTRTMSQDIRMTYNEVGNEHHWHCEPITSAVMAGAANDGQEPIMEVSPKIDQRLQDLGARVFLRCKADDFEITEIEVKKSLAERLSGENLQKRLAMAKEVLKHKLAEADLEVVDLDPLYQDVIVADILAVPE